MLFKRHSAAHSTSELKAATASSASPQLRPSNTPCTGVSSLPVVATRTPWPCASTVPDTHLLKRDAICVAGISVRTKVKMSRQDALFSLASTSTGTLWYSLVLLFQNCGKIYVTVRVILVLCGQNTICSKYLVNASMLFPVRCITTSCPCNSIKTCYSNNCYNSTIV